MATPYHYRSTGPTIEAVEHHDAFPLAFLRPGETVRKASASGNGILVTQGDNEVQVNRGDYLVRDLDTGTIRKESSHRWFDRWERVDCAHKAEEATDG